MSAVTALRTPGSAVRRAAYGIAGIGLLAAGVAATVATAAGWPVIVAAAVAADLTLLTGISDGRLHRRGVRAYNAMHRLHGPATLALSGVALGPVALVAGLAWGAHVCLDRAAGYGLRAPDGTIRAV